MPGAGAGASNGRFTRMGLGSAETVRGRGSSKGDSGDVGVEGVNATTSVTFSKCQPPYGMVLPSGRGGFATEAGVKLEAAGLGGWAQGRCALSSFAWRSLKDGIAELQTEASLSEPLSQNFQQRDRTRRLGCSITKPACEPRCEERLGVNVIDHTLSSCFVGQGFQNYFIIY